jgi:hypothetical protein
VIAKRTYKSDQTQGVQAHAVEKFSFVKLDRRIQCRMMHHHGMVHRACHQSDECMGIPCPEGTQEGCHTQHITELVMLSDDEDPAYGIRLNRIGPA